MEYDVEVKKKNAQATRDRILNAATKEFARHGIAGARVDRIAKAGRANKNLIYVYFGCKDALFTAVMGRHMRRLHDEVPLTPDDLPGYAVGLFDFALAQPDLMRLFAWIGLERRSPDSPEHTAGAAAKLAGIAQAQAAGLVRAEDTPAFIFSAVIALATAWTAANPHSFAIDPVSARDPAVHREAIRRAVQRLCCSSAADGGISRRRRRGDPARPTRSNGSRPRGAR